MPNCKITTDYPQKSEIYLDIVRRFRALLSGMAMVKDDEKTAVIQTVVNGEAIFCKRFCHGGIINSIKNQLRRSKANMSYFASKEAVKRGIPVPEHIAAIEKRTAGFLINSYLFTRAIIGALPLQHYVKEIFPFGGHYNPKEKQHFIKEIASFIAKVHSAGMIHNDLKATNIIVNKLNNNYVFHVLDLDNVSFKNTVPMSIVVKNLVQLNNDCVYVFGAFDRLRFFVYYLEKAGMKMSRAEKHVLAEKVERLTLKKVKRWQDEQQRLERKGKSKHRDDSIKLKR